MRTGFPLGETIELQHDANVIRQHRDLDLAAQAAQAERIRASF
ncbi:MAG: hypothetical protein WBZ16_02710 [Pseudolabrys sp.]